MCTTDGPSVEHDLWQYFQSQYPGQVAMLGADLFNCSASGVGSFKNATGVTFPLLLSAATATGGNMQLLYGERDHYVVINKQGIVRYQANGRWPYGNGYHIDEILGSVDSLVIQPVAVDEAPPRDFALRASPNPFRSAVTIDLLVPAAHSGPARVTVHDLAGRRVATVYEGPASPGVMPLRWDGRGDAGSALPAGLYAVRARIGAVVLERRVVHLR